ncbi:hypothetical protein CP960_09705 [Malaciobacter halophilus]|uniref:TonB C-terminal domain-containing protein n=1 Tax=Malaciobacter halophilus TaxID=197482 RepID=A0A2N1J1G7_9BACT|nr:hypothetical protein [Malaciobacter halophilus]AXH09720.1 hypothetical protein AHALO_1348 [Malaciobacter halophilus]PKI80409.1 hypothetical protein CP960_09705 [Malaciobacter halophilus]
MKKILTISLLISNSLLLSQSLENALLENDFKILEEKKEIKYYELELNKNAIYKSNSTSSQKINKITGSNIRNGNIKEVAGINKINNYFRKGLVNYNTSKREYENKREIWNDEERIIKYLDKKLFNKYKNKKLKYSYSFELDKKGNLKELNIIKKTGFMDLDENIKNAIILSLKEFNYPTKKTFHIIFK